MAKDQGNRYAASHSPSKPIKWLELIEAAFENLITFICALLMPFRPLIERIVFAVLSIGPIPEHIAIIMDGNRRFARNHPDGPMHVSQGHLSGFNALKAVLEACLRLNGMTTVTVFAFAINNFNRDKVEVDAIMELAKDNLVRLADQGEILAKHSVRLRVIGRKELLPDDVRIALENVESMTEKHNKATLNICIAYASSDEIALAADNCVKQRRKQHGEVRSSNNSDQYVAPITADDLQAHMLMTHSPPVDVLIRTSNVRRMSDFLLWQTSQAQLQFTKRYWPLFGLRELVPIILDFQRSRFVARIDEVAF